MMELFAFGTIGFWILSAVLFVMVIISLEYEEWGGGVATASFIGFFLILYFFGGKEFVMGIGSYIKHNTGTIIGFGLAYLGIGLVWSFVKWYFYLLGKKDYITENNVTHIENYIPKAKDNKGRIISWMSYWPFSAFWTIINDPIKRMFRFIYARFENLYDKMEKKMFSDLRSKNVLRSEK